MERARRRQPDVLSLLLSPRGTIDRGEFACGSVMLASFAYALDGMVLAAADEIGLIGFAFALLVFWSAGVLSRKRLHDLGWSGLTIAFFLGFYIAVVLASPFLAGSLPKAQALHSLLAATCLAGPAIGWLAWLVITPGTIAFTAQTMAVRDPGSDAADAPAAA